jgi:hypothetical protein
MYYYCGTTPVHFFLSESEAQIPKGAEASLSESDPDVFGLESAFPKDQLSREKRNTHGEADTRPPTCW